MGFGYINKNMNNINKYPLELSGYKLKKIIKRSGKYGFAIYKSGNKFAIAKFNFRNRNIFLNYWVKNEKSVLESLKHISLKRLKFPKIIAYKTTSSYQVILTEFIDGKTLENFSHTIKVKIYGEVLKTLENSKYNDASKIRTRYFALDLLFVPYLYIRSLFKDLSQIRKANKVLKNILFSLSIDTVKTEIRLSHRDLFDSNIIVDKNKIYLIDLEKMHYADKMLDISYLIIRYWSNQKFITQLFKNRYVNKILKSKINKSKLKLTLSYLILMDLATKSDLNDKEIKSLINYTETL